MVAIDFQAKSMPEAELKDVGEWLVKAYREAQSKGGKLLPQVFFREGMYQQAGLGKPLQDVFANNPETRALAQMENG
jgi:hypothetical protein